MPSLTWPATFFLSILTICVSFLVYKGTVPSHALFVIIGIAVGFFPHTILNAMRERARAAEAAAAADSFSPEEPITKNESLRPPLTGEKK
jgi:hypothetical protein